MSRKPEYPWWLWISHLGFNQLQALKSQIFAYIVIDMLSKEVFGDGGRQGGRERSGGGGLGI